MHEVTSHFYLASFSNKYLSNVIGDFVMFYYLSNASSFCMHMQRQRTENQQRPLINLGFVI